MKYDDEYLHFTVTHLRSKLEIKSECFFFFLYLELMYNTDSEIIISSKTALPGKIKFCV